MNAAQFYILMALAGGDRHGYALMREIADRSGGAVRPGPATLYRSLKHLLTEGLVEEAGDRPDPALDDERRRYYRLTGAGRTAAESEARRLAHAVDLARSLRLLPARHD
jgi:DNA-binding PadR family transcriptional regulator